MKKTVTLTAAQIQGMYAAPVEILPAPGPNLTYVINSIFAHYHFKTTPYTLGSSGAFHLCYGSTLNDFLILFPLANFLDQGQDAYVQGSIANDGGIGSGCVNAPLTATNDTNALTAGDGLVTLTLDYDVINTTTE